MKWFRRNARASGWIGLITILAAVMFGNTPAGGIRNCGFIWAGWKSWNTSSFTAAAGAGALFTSLYLNEARMMKSPFFRD